jgi:16S rRNA processing protein RimM
VDSRDRAEALRNSRLLIPEGDRPHLEEGEFYVLDLLGLEVFRQSGQ